MSLYIKNSSDSRTTFGQVLQVILQFHCVKDFLKHLTFTKNRKVLLKPNGDYTNALYVLDLVGLQLHSAYEVYYQVSAHIALGYITKDMSTCTGMRAVILLKAENSTNIKALVNSSSFRCRLG